MAKEIQEKKWYEYETENELIKHVYSKYSIKDFWNFWSNKENLVMEVRIQGYEKIREVATRFNLPFSNSGVYVNSAVLLKNAIAFTRDYTTWFGINPRKINHTKYGFKSYSSGKKGGSSEENVLSINFLFIDIDRVKKLSPATSEELKNCDILAIKILERFKKEGWNKYAKINSGNGIQLQIPLDFSIKVPLVVYDSEKKIFIPNNEFETIRKILSEGIGKQIITFCKKFKEDLKVEVDKTCFRIASVGALPCTKNFKYNSFKWRGIIEMKNEGSNIGLTDYIMNFEDDIKTFKAKNIFSNKTSALLNKNRLRKGKLRENILVKYMLENEFPEGYVNNTWWLQLKCLLRDSKIDLTSKEFIILHKELCQKHNRTFSLNMPEKKFTFNEDVINAYCINNQMPPVYEIWPNRTKKLNMKLEELSWDIINFVDEEIELDRETTILQDLNNCRDSLVEASYNNVTEVGKFIKGLITKYGEEKTKYYYKYLFERGLNWK